MPKIKIRLSSIMLFASILVSENKILSLSVLICATIHELGHIVSALLLKIKIKRFEFSICGAKIIPTQSLCTYLKELILCFCGPLANFITFALCLPAVNITSNSDATSLDFFTYMALFSILLGVINLLPIKSLDGGRILFCIMAPLIGDRAGNITVKICSIVTSIIIWMFSVYLLILSPGGIIFFAFSLCMLLKIFEN